MSSRSRNYVKFGVDARHLSCSHTIEYSTPTRRTTDVSLTKMSSARRSHTHASQFKIGHPRPGHRLEAKPFSFNPPANLRIPPDTEAMNLIREYFGTAGLIFPCIHEANFIATYHEMRRSNFELATRSWLGMLYMIFAHVHATRSLSFPSGEALKSSVMFYRGALSMLLPGILFDSGLENGESLSSAPEVIFPLSSWLLGSASSAAALLYSRIPEGITIRLT